MPRRPPYMKNTISELKELCRACNLKVGGTKPEIVARLCANEHSSVYSGISTAEIKAEAKSKGLVVTGKRFDLVLRLLQLTCGTGAPKRAVGEILENGEFQPKKRAKSMKLPTHASVEAFRQRIENKIFYVDSSKFSNWKHKYYANDVLTAICKTLTAEVLEKELCSRGEVDLAWYVVHELLEDFTGCFRGSGSVVEHGWGYLDCGGSLGDLNVVLRRLMDATALAKSKEAEAGGGSAESNTSTTTTATTSPGSDNFEKCAKLLESFRGLVKYGYNLDNELKIIMEVARELRALFTAVVPAAVPAALHVAVVEGSEKVLDIVASDSASAPVSGYTSAPVSDSASVSYSAASAPVSGSASDSFQDAGAKEDAPAHFTTRSPLKFIKSMFGL